MTTEVATIPTAPTMNSAAPIKKAKAPKTSGIKKVAKKSTHPAWAEMITNAVKELHEKGGSSIPAIKKYLAANYKIEADKSGPFMKRGVKAAITNGTLIQAKGHGLAGSFKLGSGAKKAPKKIKSPTATATKKVNKEKKTSKKSKSTSTTKKAVTPTKKATSSSPTKKSVKKPKATTTTKPATGGLKVKTPSAPKKVKTTSAKKSISATTTAKKATISKPKTKVPNKKAASPKKSTVMKSKKAPKSPKAPKPKSTKKASAPKSALLKSK